MSKSTRNSTPTVTRFRALILGRANAGKTTILKSICGSTDGPVIDKVAPSTERGEHDINYELTFRSNPRFVFHDSKGFECGSEQEVKIVNDFIYEKANATTLDAKLHAIWYCVPTDDPRLVTAAEENFFDKCDPQGVPVILIFTKFDALDAQAFDEITEGNIVEGAHRLAAEHAEKKFHVQWSLFESREYPPKKIIYLRDMNDEEDVDAIKDQCTKIIKATTENLTDNTLKHLLISVQQVNTKLCAKYAIEFSKGKMYGQPNVREALQQAVQSDLQTLSWKQSSDLWRAVLVWFPHVILLDKQVYNKPQKIIRHDDHLHGGLYGDGGHGVVDLLYFKKLHLPLKCDLPPNLWSLYHCACSAIIIEHSFWLGKSSLINALSLACQHFTQSNTASCVARAILDLFNQEIAHIQNMLNNEDLYHKQISPKLYTIVEKHLLSQDYNPDLVQDISK